MKRRTYTRQEEFDLTGIPPGADHDSWLEQENAAKSAYTRWERERQRQALEAAGYTDDPPDDIDDDEIPF